jgi:nicotinate-nucleotide--dimethylbenzimidazole phosphoribosyltransferase
MPANQTPISPTANPTLDRALRVTLEFRAETVGSMGELEPLAIRLGLVQDTLKPRFRDPHIVLFASDHGLAVDGIGSMHAGTSALRVQQVLNGQLPVSIFARMQGLQLTVVDAGLAEPMERHAKLLARKIAHGTRNARVGNAMTLEQANAAIRAGMEIANTLSGNVIACAGLGIGSHESAALVLSRLADCPVRDLVVAGADMRQDDLAHLLVVLQGAQGRHREVTDPIEVLAAFGGFEIAMMVGVMLVAASKRHLIIIDGMAACAALKVAAAIAAPVTDYAVFCRSHSHRGLDEAMALFHASALLELGMESADGTGATLAWPLIRSAAALLSDVSDADDPTPSRPGDWSEPSQR